MTTPLDERWRIRDLSQRLESIWRTDRADGPQAIDVAADVPVEAATDVLIDVHAVAEVDSTNTCLLEAARNDTVAHLRLLVAQAQTAGRGRLGRAWHASPGASLAFSLAVPMAPDIWSSLIVGAAVADALEPQQRPTSSQVRPHVMLKWPNDLWLRDTSSPFGGRKLGGILLETAATATGRVLVAGIGLNLRAVAPVDAPTYGVASLDELAAPGEGIDAPDVLLRVAPAVLAALLRPQRGAGWRDAWTRRDLLAGQRIEVGPPPGRSQGGPAPGDTKWPLQGREGSERSEPGGTGPPPGRSAPAPADTTWPLQGRGGSERSEPGGANAAKQRITGIARGIDDDGALRLQRDEDGQIVVISSGEVSVRPLPG